METSFQNGKIIARGKFWEDAVYDVCANDLRVRFDGKGGITKEGEQVVLGANDKYIGLCRRHWRIGDPGPDLRA